MANHASAEKRIRRNERRSVINHARLSRIRTFIKNVLLAVQAGNASDAETAFKVAQPEIQRGVAKGVIKKNTAARRIARLHAQVSRLKA